MNRIPIAAVPAQTLTVTLAGQLCKINLTQRPNGVFMDLFIAGVPVAQDAICLDRTRVVRYKYLGFAGDLSFVDTQGASDPVYTGFNSRYLLVYLP